MLLNTEIRSLIYNWSFSTDEVFSKQILEEGKAFELGEFYDADLHFEARRDVLTNLQPAIDGTLTVSDVTPAVQYSTQMPISFFSVMDL